MVLTTCSYAIFISLGVLSVSGTASATLIEAIANLNEGDKYRVVFVTSTTRDATSSDISDYNDFVSNLALSGTVTSTLGLEWTALASTSAVNAQVNTGISNLDSDTVNIFNTNGEIIATSGEDLWDGNLANPIRYDENRFKTNEIVRTGTTSNGENNNNYELGEVESYTGLAFNQIFVWINFDFDQGENDYSFYGVSESVTKQIVEAPAPGTVILLSLGLAGLSFALYRRQS